MLNKLLQFVLFGFTMFAAGAPAVGESGGDADAAGAGDALGDSGDTGYGGGDSAEATVSAESSDDSEGAASGDADESDSGEADTHKPAVDETSDLKGAVSRRLQAFVKKSPALATALKDPGAKEFVDFVEATARRDMAYRELYPTVAEARQMREQFPNGIADVEQLLGEAQEISRLDTDFVTRNANGDYAGHPRIIQGMFEQDRDAALSLFRAIPKEWARLDRDSYNEVMGQIVGATFAQRGLPEYLGEMVEAAKEAKQDGLARELGKLANWVNGYLKEKPQPSEAEQRLEMQRQQLQRTESDRKKEDHVRFQRSFNAESDRLQQSIIRKHPSMELTLKTQGISEQKKLEIVRKVQERIRQHLGSSRAFMGKLRPAFNQGNLDECLKLQKAQWSYPWVLNKFVRQVLSEETPNLVRQNRERTRGAAGPVPSKKPAATGEAAKQRTAPYKDTDGRWKKKDGTPFSTAELLRGLHLS